MQASLYIGLMSGTSMDGIDAALISIDDKQTITLLGTHSHSWPDELRHQLESLALPGDNEIDRLGEADAWAGELFAQAVNALLDKLNISCDQIKAIGSHGQTVRHRPHSRHPFTLQIGDPNRIAARTGITTVADFRRRDIAVGGQGAPLAPAFHQAMFHSPEETRVIVNIGGIANITILPKDPKQPVTGFDSGPGNRLMDDWIAQSNAVAYDHNGNWAASGTCVDELLASLTETPYFARKPPKSTGTEEFNLAWLRQTAKQLLTQSRPQDVQRTLLELTAISVADAVKQHAPDAAQLLVCGGGAHNHTLMKSIQTQLTQLKVATTADIGIDPDWVEAAAFAWLAQRTLHGHSGNLVEVTGANEKVPLGCIYPV